MFIGWVRYSLHSDELVAKCFVPFDLVSHSKIIVRARQYVQKIHFHVIDIHARILLG